MMASRINRHVCTLWLILLGGGCTDMTDASDALDTDRPGREPGRNPDTADPLADVRLSQSPSIDGLPILDVLPVPGAVLDSGFGPRRISSEDYRTDFHPGLDLDAPLGTTVRATADGTVRSIDHSSDNGHILVLEHQLASPILFHGEQVSTWYARYLHLQEVTLEEGDRVEAGDKVGSVGRSGDVVEPHTHFEVRLGTWCSLRYSLENPSSGCARDYDPAINPLHLLPMASNDLFTATILSTSPLTIQITVEEGDFDLNRIEARAHVLDFDLREGLDPSSEDALDNFELGWVSIDPVRDADEPDHQSWILSFPGNPEYVDFYDIEGQGLRVGP